MNVFTVDESYSKSESRNAGSKAREDIRKLLRSEIDVLEFPNESKPDAGASLPSKIVSLFKSHHKWRKVASSLEEGDIFYVQYPLIPNAIFFSRVIKECARRRVNTVLLVHDIESARTARTLSNLSPRKNFKLAQEKAILESASCLIIHNLFMEKYLANRYGISSEKMVDLGIFDYLCDPPVDFTQKTAAKNAPIVIAGNLSPEKAGYIYDLPAGVDFSLYGLNADISRLPANACWRGSFSPNEGPSTLDGSFGLVWDGPSADTCSGAYGEYLRINNPHKTSLYLAAGMPVIIWDQAALAPFILENGVGIAVSSLDEIPGAIASLTDEAYDTLVKNARTCADDIASGSHLKCALAEALEKMGVSR